jgi:O-methyltransferase
MIKILRKIINSFLIKTINYRFVNNTEYTLQQNSIKTDSVLEKDFLEINEKINKIYKMNTLNETNYSAYQTVKNALSLKLKGSIVECGVYQGQKINYFLETLNILKINNIDIYIIDTFEGMTESSNKDIQMITKKVMKKNDLSASLESVKDRIYQTNYPKDKLHFIKMDVRNENDLRNAVKGDIIILRLDTDFYDSTLASLNSLYSKVVKNGFIIHDDYGHWKGHYDACQKFYSDNNIDPILLRTCRQERIEIKN